MNLNAFFAAAILLLVSLAGCSTTPEPEPVVTPTTTPPLPTTPVELGNASQNEGVNKGHPHYLGPEHFRNESRPGDWKVLPYESSPEGTINAYVIDEDVRFYSHFDKYIPVVGPSNESALEQVMIIAFNLENAEIEILNLAARAVYRSGNSPDTEAGNVSVPDWREEKDFSGVVADTDGLFGVAILAKSSVPGRHSFGFLSAIESPGDNDTFEEQRAAGMLHLVPRIGVSQGFEFLYEGHRVRTEPCMEPSIREFTSVGSFSWNLGSITGNHCVMEFRKVWELDSLGWTVFMISSPFIDGDWHVNITTPRETIDETYVAAVALTAEVGGTKFATDIFANFVSKGPGGVRLELTGSGAARGASTSIGLTANMDFVGWWGKESLDCWALGGEEVEERTGMCSHADSNARFDT